MDRIAAAFSRGKKALVVFLTAGFPETGADEKLALDVIDAGADILELGFPFSDPVADGPLIQEASRRALRNGTTLSSTMELAGRIRGKSDIPILLMGYANPVHHLGYEAFSGRLSREGCDGAIIPDLPVHAAGPLRDPMREEGLALIPMAAPNTPPGRLEEIMEGGDGFLYLVSMAGLTGDAFAGGSSWKETASLARGNGRLPVCLGFGIRTPQDAVRAVRHADGVIVGSAVTALIREAADFREARVRVRNLVGRLAEAIR